MTDASPCDLLGVFAHPDDESLLCGGMLAACAAAGHRVGVVSLTRGEAGPGLDQSGSATELGRVREAELLAATAELGVSWALCLGFPDGSLRSVDPALATAALADVLAASTPRAVLTFAEDGLYWHPDHLAVRDFVLHAARNLQVHEATWSRERVQRVVRDARRANLPAGLWGIAPDTFGSPEGSLACMLDVRRFLTVKRRALRCHRTQLTAEHLLLDLPEHLEEQLLGYEWLKSPQGGGWVAEIVDPARQGATRK